MVLSYNIMGSQILLVEDDPFLQKLYLDLLSGEKYDVTISGDGEDAYNKMKEGGYDLVLVDYMLPTMNALDILKKLKNEPPKVPNKAIVLLTNMDNKKDLQETADMTKGYIIKSDLNPEQLLEKVKSFL